MLCRKGVLPLCSKGCQTVRSRSFILVALVFSGWARCTAGNLDDYINSELHRQRIAGLSIVVIENGQIVKARGYGLANLETGDPATVETVYKIGSVSKSFLAAAVMLLAEDGKLKLEDSVDRYLESVPESWRSITIRHLLTHTSGLVEDPPGFDPFKALPDADVIRSIYPVPLLFTPGEKWRYSNAGYFVLGQVITRVSGKPWAEFLSERVFRPLKMDATRTTTTTEIVPHRAGGYVWASGQFKKSEDWVAVRPSGAFLSTVLDLARWDDAVRSRSLLKAASWDQILAPVHLNNNEKFGYGFGFALDPWQKHRRIYHIGQLPGFLTVLEDFPDDHFTIIAMTNTDEFDTAKVVHSIAGFYRPELEITNASASNETIGWNVYEFLFGTIDEPANDALANNNRQGRHSTGFSSM